MKATILILFLFLFLLCCNNVSKHGNNNLDTIILYEKNIKYKEEIFENKNLISEKYFYDNGNLWSVRHYKNGLIEGECKLYYYSGKIKFEILVENKQGYGKTFNEKGFLESEGNFFVGYHIGEISLKKINKHNIYYESGKLKSIENYDSIGLNGVFLNYYENGILKQEGFYKNSFLDSVWKYYNDKGNLIKEEFYKFDTLLKTIKYD